MDLSGILERGRNLTIGQGLKLVLLVQAVVAVFLIIADIETRWRFDSPSDGPGQTEPISPGDQVRRYDPTRPTPQFSTPGNDPDITMPTDLPPRLEFSLREDDDMGTLLVVNGPIQPGDAGRFEAYLESLESAPDAVALNSPGGIVDEALDLGRLVRSRGLDTLILPGTACLSSCPYVLAGGVERRVSGAGAVGLHQHYYETPGYIPVFFAVEDIQRSQGETMGYLVEMGIDPGVMVHGLKTPPDDIYVLVEEELLESRIATHMGE